ncbi:MAG: tRNA 2-thiouridine(34) synthase MnmA, partial [Microbacteriaceae bacterium]
MKVLAAMSGGVDSAVAAARAVEAGHEVVGVHLALSRMPGTLRTGSRGCCTIEDSMDAQRVTNLIGIPYYVWDFSAEFQETVIEDFISEYSAGRTPNPCMRCNEKIKFAALLDKAIALGFDAVCTGHYADIEFDEAGNPSLKRAAAWAKDQSYVLGVLTTEQLKYCMFPLGSTPSKAEVRAEAEERGFALAQKPDSHDICFIPDGDTRGWLAEKVGVFEGDIVDSSGHVLGSHQGAHSYTVGQRKGLNIGYPSADGKPRFVLEIRPKSNTVVVGAKEELDVIEIAGRKFSWAGLDPVASNISVASADGGVASFECEVQIRAHADPVIARAEVRLVNPEDYPEGAEVISHTRLVDTNAKFELRIVPNEPLSGVAPGQTAV